MKKISYLTTLHQARSGEQSEQETHEKPRSPFVQAAAESMSSTSGTGIGRSHIDRIWERMSQIFGHKWSSSFGAEPSETWLAGLIDMTEEEIRTGLVACLNWAEEWPPTLPQFRSLCRPRREEAHKVFIALPDSPENRERRLQAGKSAIASIRESLAGGRRDEDGGAA